MTLREFAEGTLKVVGYTCVAFQIMREPDIGVTAATNAWIAGDEHHAVMFARLADAGFEYQGRDPLAGV